ncbi:MAG: phosphoribosyl-ATP diphosphatase [Pseudomonadota bacterium]
MQTEDFVKALYLHVKQRKSRKSDVSYTAQLLEAGHEKIGRKICEESTEILLELLRKDKKGMIRESADLLYHLTVAWIALNINPQQIADELYKRQNDSGLEEKAARQNKL